MATVRELITKLGFKLDRISLDRAKKGADNVKKGMEDAGNAGDKAGRKISDSAKRGADALNQEAKAAKRVGKEMDKLSEKSLASKGTNMAMTGAALGAAGAATLSPLAAAAKQGMDFDYAMTRFAAVALSDKKGTEFDAAKKEMRDLARQKGRDTIFDADEVANAMYYMGMAGWKNDQIKKSLQDVLNLAIISGADLATVSDIVTDDLTAMGMEAGDAGKMVDMLAAVSTNANTDVLKMGETMKYVGAVAGSLGFQFRDVAIASGIMASAGTKAEMAGTALRATMLRLLDPPKDAAEALNFLGVKTIDEATGEMKPFMKLIDELRTAMDEKGLTKAQKTDLSAAISGRYAAAGFASLMTAKPEDIDKITRAVDNSTGAGQRFADVMGETLKNKIKGVESALKELSLIINDNFGDILIQAADAMKNIIVTVGNWIKANPKLTKTIMGIVGVVGSLLSIVGSAMVAVGGLAALWGLVGEAVTTAFSGGIVAAFSGALAAIQPFIWPIVAAFVALGSVIAYLSEHWDEIMADMEPDFEILRAAVESFLKSWETIGPVIMTPLGIIIDLIGGSLVWAIKTAGKIFIEVFNSAAAIADKLAIFIGKVANELEWLGKVTHFGEANAANMQAGIDNSNRVTEINNNVNVNSAEEAASYVNGTTEMYGVD